MADTHGIVYTPQPIVDFMVRSVDELLRAEFGRSLGDAGVHILDPFVGTGNFIVRLMREIPKTRLAPKYATELHCNEVMLLPYYIASMNIEHAYFEMTGDLPTLRGPLPGGHLRTGRSQTSPPSSPKKNRTVERQRKTPIFVIIGNPPYNAGQLNENDNNKNRKYPVMDGRVSETYAKDSKATNQNNLSDPYVKAIRWATDRSGTTKASSPLSPITALSTRSPSTACGSTWPRISTQIYVLDLGGNVRKNPKLSGTTHNVFGIQVGVSISFFRQEKCPWPNAGAPKSIMPH